MATLGERSFEMEGPPSVPPTPPATPRRRGLAGAALLLLLGLAVGIGVAAWAARESATAARLLAGRQEPPTVIRLPPAAAPAATVPTRTDPMLAEEVEAIDRRLDAIDARASAAVGDADRAEGLLVAFAARRAIERGVQLGYLERLLREHFLATEPRAVAAVISAARAPVSLADLRQGLAEAEPALLAGTGATSTWDSFRRELSNLLVIRRASANSTAPVDRFERASGALDAGEVDQALAEVARMPGHAGAAAWIAQARRYLAARIALDRLETAALVSPPPAPPAI